MDIPGQLQKIRILFTDDRLVPVLEKMPLSLMPPIESNYVSGQDFSHAHKNGTIARSYNQVQMVRKKRPSISLQGFRLALLSQAR
jgi:hypothetical protein